MEKYFLILKKRLVKGVSVGEKFTLASTAYEYIDEEWEDLDPNEINDRLMGYDPSEVDMYSIGNTDIMEEIEEVSEDEIGKYM